MVASGIRAELKIAEPGECPVAELTAESDVSGYSLSKSTTDETTVTEEMMLTTDGEVESDMEELFSYGDESVYRFQRERGLGCACERVERFDCPVVDVRTRDGALFVTFHTPDVETLREVVTDLREAYAGVDVRRLLQSSGEDESDLVLVERGRLTDRQREVLELAHELGYFDHPKRANKGDIAAELGVTTSTVSEHLSMAQRKLMESILRH